MHTNVELKENNREREAKYVLKFLWQQENEEKTNQASHANPYIVSVGTAITCPLLIA